MESLPKVETCCCGCNLKTGTKIIGWLGLIGYLILAMSSIGVLVYLGSQPKPTDDSTETIHIILKVALWIALVLSALGVIFDLLLLIGVYQEKQKFVKFYIIVTAVLLVVGIIIMIFNIFGGGDAKAIIQTIVRTALEIYFLIVVNSYYFTMPGVGTGSYA